MKRLSIIVTAALIMSLGALFVIADQDAQTDVGATGQYTVTSAEATLAEGGNVTEVNVTSTGSTDKWQGFYGNVSGNLALGDGATVFFNWTGASFSAIFASPGSTVDWGSVSGIAGAPAMNGKDTDYGFTNTDSDSITNTFGGASCTAGTYLAAADGATPYNSTTAGIWETCIGEDSGGALDDTVFGTNIASGDSFAGTEVDYQLLVPVIAANDNYYFYLEV